MKVLEIKGLGVVELQKHDNEYVYRQDEMFIENNNVSFDLHFKEVTDEVLEKVNNVMVKLNEILDISQKLILHDFDNKGEVDYYLNEWIEEYFTDEELADFISDSNPAETVKKRLLSKLNIVRIGIYTYAETDFLTLDYAFGKDVDSGFRDDMLVVCLNSQCNLMSISNEG